MNDLIYLDSFYWLFSNTMFSNLSGAILTFVVVTLSLLLIIKKWGGDY